RRDLGLVEGSSHSRPPRSPRLPEISSIRAKCPQFAGFVRGCDSAKGEWNLRGYFHAVVSGVKIPEVLALVRDAYRGRRVGDDLWMGAYGRPDFLWYRLRRNASGM